MGPQLAPDPSFSAHILGEPSVFRTLGGGDVIQPGAQQGPGSTGVINHDPAWKNMTESMAWAAIIGSRGR